MDRWRRILAGVLIALLVCLVVPGMAIAADDSPTSITIEVPDGAELPDGVENAGTAVDAADDLDMVSSLEYWQLLAVGLPIAIGHLGNMFGLTSTKAKAWLSLGIYFGYAALGEVLKGSFDQLTWDSPQLVLASLIKVAGISYAAYKILGNAAPRLVGGQPSPYG